MPAKVSRVRTLRLRAADRDEVGRGTRLVREALQLAETPSDRDGLVLVRRLDLGRIDPRSSVQTIVRLVEARLREAAPLAVHASSPQAPSANVVAFADRAEAIALAVERALSGRAPSAWFWARVLGRGVDVSRVLRAPFRPPGSPEEALTLLAATVRLAQSGTYLPLLHRTEPALIVELRRGLGLTPLPEVEGSGTATPPALVRGWARTLLLGARRFPADDPRRQWLGEVGLVAEDPARLADPEVSLRAKELVTLAVGRPADLPPPSPEEGDPSFPHSVLQPWADPGVATRAAGRLPPSAGPTSNARPPTGVAPPVSSTADMESAQAAAAPEQRELAVEPSDHAGLALLIGVLRRLGFDEWLEENPGWIEMELPRRVLELAAIRVGAPHDDPALRAMRPTRSTHPQSPSELRLPDAWWQPDSVVRRKGAMRHVLLPDGRLTILDASGTLPLEVQRSARQEQHATDPTVPADTAILATRAWLLGAMRWLRRRTELSLRTLVCRRGRVHAGRSHLDVHFEVAAADLRVRRHGLDLDPGWLPWLGRVVSYHFDLERSSP